MSLPHFPGHLDCGEMFAQKGESRMATRYPAEFRQRAVELARLREKPIRQLATDLGISDQTLHNWLKQADIDEGRREG